MTIQIRQVTAGFFCCQECPRSIFVKVPWSAAFFVRGNLGTPNWDETTPNTCQSAWHDIYTTCISSYISYKSMYTTYVLHVYIYIYVVHKTVMSIYTIAICSKMTINYQQLNDVDRLQLHHLLPAFSPGASGAPVPPGALWGATWTVFTAGRRFWMVALKGFEAENHNLRESQRDLSTPDCLLCECFLHTWLRIAQWTMTKPWHITLVCHHIWGMPGLRWG